MSDPVSHQATPSSQANDARRERNRRRWRRRRRHQIAALLVLLPLLVGAGILSTNVVQVLGGAHSAYDVLARPRTVPAKDAVRTEHLHDKLPVMLPVSDTADFVGKPSVRLTEPLPQRFYQPGSHISPLVKWKLSQLKTASRQQSAQPIALSHRAPLPERLNAVAAVFEPTHLELASLDDPLDQFWEMERIFIETTPGGNGTSIGGTQIPEPGTGVLMSLGLVGIAIRRRQRRARLTRA